MLFWVKKSSVARNMNKHKGPHCQTPFASGENAIQQPKLLMKIYVKGSDLI